MNLISILGQTSSGKSQLAVDLAKILSNNNKKVIIVSNDSRQIYKGLNIGTAKIDGAHLPFDSNSAKTAVFWQDVPHFLIDYVDPDKRYTLVQYLQDFVNLIKDLESRADTIILVGGTGLWAKAIIDQYQPGIIKGEFEQEYLQFKKTIDNWDLEQMQQQYQTLLETDPSLQVLNQSDYHNPRRVLNWLLRTHAAQSNWNQDIIYPQFVHSLCLAIEVNQDNLKNRIATNLDRRIQMGLINETADLIKRIGAARLLELGLEYRLAVQHLQYNLNYSDFLNQIHLQEWQYAKRQLTWLKKQDLNWVAGLEQILELGLLGKVL